MPAWSNWLATGKLRELPRMSEKSEQKILKAIEDYRRISGRFLLDEADRTAEKLTEHLKHIKGIEKITPAGSLRRGRETVGDLDMLITGPCCIDDGQRAALIEEILRFPGIVDVLAKGDNKVSFKLRSGMQVDVRTLAPESYGAAMQYFTGSKGHNVTLRQRALKMGLTLNEYGLFRLEDNKRVAGVTEDEIYGALKLDCIPPEMRENCGEIDLAAEHKLPQLITVKDIRGEVHMHTVETDGKCTIEEMAEAAKKRGYKYIAITDHSKNLAFANGLDDKRAVEHIARIHAANEQIDGITIMAGIEVDILADGELDLSDSVMEQMDVVVASVHSAFNQEPQQMTDRLLRALGQQECLDPRTSDGTAAAAPRRLSFRHGCDPESCAEEQSGDGVERLSRPARLERRAPADGARARGENRHQYRRASHLALREDQVRNSAGAAGMAHA